MDIKVSKMTNPPEKMKLMFDAVSELVKQNKGVSEITVREITSIAGIGKGTAYEYFASKEELIANALMYEYCNKIQMLAKMIFKPQDFKARCYKIMDWIKENKEYNKMFSHIMNVSLGSENFLVAKECCENNEFILAAQKYIYDMINKLMNEGYEQKVFSEKNREKRSLALLSSMVEYSFVVMGPYSTKFISMSEEEIREFVYNSMIKSLS